MDELPAASGRTVPALPEVIDPPASSPLLVDDPIDIAVVAVERKGVAQLLSPSGVWRTVPLKGRYPRLQLSPDGTQLAVYYYGDRKFEVTVHDLATGEAHVLRAPPAFATWDGSAWVFRNEDELLLGGSRSAYVVSIDSGAAERLPYRAGLSQAVDPAGNLLVSAQWSTRNVLTDYRPETPRVVSMALTGRLSSIRAGGDTVVGTSYDKRPFALVVADRKTLKPQASLPLLDYQGNYSNWGLSTLALLDDGRVLLRVAVIGPGKIRLSESSHGTPRVATCRSSVRPICQSQRQWSSRKGCSEGPLRNRLFRARRQRRLAVVERGGFPAIVSVHVGELTDDLVVTRPARSTVCRRLRLRSRGAPRGTAWTDLFPQPIGPRVRPVECHLRGEELP